MGEIEEANEEREEMVRIAVLPDADVKSKNGVGAVVALDAEEPKPTLAATPDEVTTGVRAKTLAGWATERGGGVPSGGGW